MAGTIGTLAHPVGWPPSSTIIGTFGNHEDATVSTVRGWRLSNLDKQITNALDKMHLEINGGRTASGCRWYYSSSQDIYHCPHTAIRGSDLMQRIPEWLAQQTSEPNPTKQEWDNSPESHHQL